MLRRFRAWQERRRRALALKNIRECMAFFGVPLDDWPDEKIEAACEEMARIAALSGVTADELTEACSVLATIAVMPQSPVELLDLPDRFVAAGQVIDGVRYVGEKIEAKRNRPA